MSTKPIVVLIHGMGTHTAPKPKSNERGSFGNECINTFNAAFKKRQGILPSYFIKELIQESDNELV